MMYVCKYIYNDNVIDSIYYHIYYWYILKLFFCQIKIIKYIIFYNDIYVEAVEVHVYVYVYEI